MNNNTKYYTLPIVAPGLDDTHGDFTGNEVHVYFPNDLRTRINHKISDADESDIDAIMFVDVETGEFTTFDISTADPDYLQRDEDFECLIYTIASENIRGTQVRSVYGEDRLILEVYSDTPREETAEAMAELGSVAFETRWMGLQSERLESDVPIQIEEIKATVLELLHHAGEQSKARKPMLKGILNTLQTDASKYPEVQSFIDAIREILEGEV